MKELIEKLFEAGAHYGLSRSRRHPSMKKNMFGAKDNMEIINLEKTTGALEGAVAYAKELGSERKTLLVVGSKNEARDIVEEESLKADTPYVNNRWIGGTLTNYDEIKKRLALLRELSEKKEKGELGMYTKKERLMIDRQIEDLTKNFGGIVNGMDGLPHALLVIDPRTEEIAVTEAKTLNIPVIAIANSDCDVSSIAHAVPANDGSRATIKLLVGEILATYGAAKAAAPKPAPKEEKPKPKK